MCRAHCSPYQGIQPPSPSQSPATAMLSSALLDEQFVFFHLKTQPFDWQHFDDLSGMTLGGGLEYSYGPAFDAFLAEGKVCLERVSSDRQNFEKLLQERVVLYPQEINVGYAALRNTFSSAEAERITHHRKPLLVNRSCLMLPRQLAQSDVLRERFNARLQQFRDDGRYQQYFDDLQPGHYQPVPEMPRHNRKNEVPGFPPARE
jgi:polar amino acid transport system substrate-binding protein